MSMFRPIEHLAFPSFLQNHSPGRPGLDLADPRVFDQFLRRRALVSRGLVVADSDLNNNEIFHKAAEHDGGLFWPAVRSGFIRRAARGDDAGHPLTQREIAEGLKKSSPHRFAVIPPGYPARLDAALASSETGAPPLIWTPQQVSQRFTSRLLAMLAIAAADPSRDSPQRDMITAISGWVSEQASTGGRFGAADIETRLQPARDTIHYAAWEAVWRLVLEAQTGNIPQAFGGRLTVIGVPEARDRMIPAGPESGPEERAVQAQIYAGGNAMQGIELEVRGFPSELPSFCPRPDRLDELSLEQVEELREAAEPDGFLTADFEARGSSAAMTAMAPAWLDAAGAFVERLASAGSVLTRQSVRTRLQEAKVVAVVNDLDRAVEYAMMHYRPWPSEGPQIVLTDFTSLMDRLEMEQGRQFLRGDMNFYCIYKRPDYQIVEVMNDAPGSG